MSEELKTVLKFEVKSLNRTRKTIEYVKDAEALADDIQKAIAQKYPGATVTIKREEGVPIAPLIQHLIVSIDWHAVKIGVEEAVAAFATTQVLATLKKKLQDLSAKPVSGDTPPGAGKPSGTKTRTKKTTKRTGKGASK